VSDYWQLPRLASTSAARALGLAAGPVALLDPLAPVAAAAVGPAAPALPAPVGGAAPAAGAHLGGGGLGALAAALGGGAPAPAAAVAVPPGAGGGGAPPVAAAAGGDPREMALVLDDRGFRDISFSDAVKLQTGTVCADQPVKGPRCRGLPEPLASDEPLSEHDENVALHETLCRVIETALCHDQLVICELASYEYLARQLRLAEGRAFEGRSRRAQPAAKAKAQAKEASPADLASEVGHFLGAGETKGNLCISPALMDWIADQMKMEAAVAKWMGLANFFPSIAGLVNLTQRRSRFRLASRRPGAAPIASATFFFLWMGAAICPLVERRVFELPGELCATQGDVAAPAVQTASVEHLAGLYREFELPADSIVLQGWGQSMLNPESVAAELRGALGIGRPCVDPELCFQPKSHAQFLKQLEARDMIAWRVASPQSSHSIGLFFVEKSNRMLRLVFGTSLANCSFDAPPAGELPTPGMESLFSLPAISNGRTGLKSIYG
ncbi:unnamed protein product, partial [Prorocentrum cordatum]